ncbi:MAG: LTA synthase family protein [Candidatus Accumulibacter sp.]|jgi:phosphoglycerol transferase MdoB-like AlkP superfamily enzyme|nr:LTA synthase family protein [Accumulibacter sp.]
MFDDMKPPLAYPRLRYLLAGTGLFFAVFALLRAGFYLWASEVSLRGPEAADAATVLETLGMGLRFDLRLAILLMLPPALLLVLPFRKAIRIYALRVWLALAILLVALIYIVDFGHYAYLGWRANATLARFLGDARISADMVWQSYPVVWIALAWWLTSAALFALFLRLERRTLDRPARFAGKAAIAGRVALVVVLGFLGILGRVTGINPANPVPLRWSDAFFSGNTRISMLGLNPVIFIWDTSRTADDRYDLAAVREHAGEVAAYLGAKPPELAPNAALPRFDRDVPAQPHRLKTQRPPNVVFIMMESLGGSVTGMHGNPHDPTPNLDALARESWFLRNFYVPVTGTAKTVWASITGTPDVSRTESATRNPFLLPQHTVLNAFAAHGKHYAIGGSSGWAHMSALIKSSIDGVQLHEEGEWKSPNIDVWGISDLALFRETDALLRALPKDRPFFIIIQTADNHPPFTIPADNDGFEIKELPDDALPNSGFRGNAQYNAVRLLDHNIGRFMAMAKESGYYDDTIFVLYGDHNGRISRIPFKSRAYEELNLESLHVPGIIHAPKLIDPRVTEEATSLIDLLPTVAGLLGVEYRNTTLGRDIQLPAPEGERAVPLVLREGAFPLLGVVTRRHLLRMNADGSQAALYEVDSNEIENLASRHPEEFARLSALARGLHETARVMLYSNKTAGK